MNGKSSTIRRSDLVEVKDTARLLGINLNNCVFDGERENTVTSIKSAKKSSLSKSKSSGIEKKPVLEEETLATDDSNQSDSFKCDICNSVFRTSKYLYAHRRKQHKILKRKEDKSDSENLKYNICGTVFKARKYYIRHRLRSHGLRTSKLINVASSNGNKCDVCGSFFKKRNYLLRHRFKQHGLRTRKMNLKLKANENIKNEKLIKEEVEEGYENLNGFIDTELDEGVGEATTFIDETCDFCGEMFESHDDLNQHKITCS